MAVQDKLPPSGHPRKRPSNAIVRSGIALSVIAAAVLIGGFGYGVYAAFGGRVGGNTALTTPQTGGGSSGFANGTQVGNATATSPGDKHVNLVAIGDSLAHGLGDASGRGFVGDVSQMYRQQGKLVVESNLGIDGLTSRGLRNEVGQPEVQNLLKTANVVLISIGGNDLNNAAGLPNLNRARIDAANQDFNRNLTDIVTRIRQTNKTAAIVVIGLYNPYGQVSATVQQTNGIVQSWNADEARIVDAVPGAVVVQTFDLFQLHPSDFLYLDHFHPNAAGYTRIANRVWQDLQGG